MRLVLLVLQILDSGDHDVYLEGFHHWMWWWIFCPNPPGHVLKIAFSWLQWLGKPAPVTQELGDRMALCAMWQWIELEDQLDVQVQEIDPRSQSSPCRTLILAENPDTCCAASQDKPP